MFSLDEIVEPKLSYEVMSVLFKVHNKLGNRLQEKHYQKAIEEELKSRNIQFEKEKRVDILYEGKKIGTYFLDFVVEKKIVVETKTIPKVTKLDSDQLMSYLRQLQVKLGIIANFRTQRLAYRRVILSEKYLK